jgi:hypothetical protein
MGKGKLTVEVADDGKGKKIRKEERKAKLPKSLSLIDNY